MNKLANLLPILIVVLALMTRFYKIGEIPPSLYWDEASLGYNAYSILKTARDEHGIFLPLTNFAAFGDYKPPGYIYLSVIPIFIFSLTEFAIRFPSALFGTLTVLTTYLLAKKLFLSEQIARLSALFLAISVWHIHHSRAAFEGNVALFLSLTGIYFFIRFALGSRLWLLLSAIFFLSALYTFTGQRLFVPLILLILLIQFRKEVFRNLLWVFMIAFFSTLLSWPLFIFSTQTIEGRLRFNEVTIFQDLKPINDSRVYRETDKFSLWSNLLHNRRYFYSHEYLRHYFDAFDPKFLFLGGDVNPRLSIQKIGELYLFDLLFILTGAFYLIKNRFKYWFLILGWLFISPLGPATARETPHALRMIHILPTFQMLSAYGLINFLSQVNRKKIFIILTAIIIFSLHFYYNLIYFYYWPKTFSGEWQYGYKEAVKTAQNYYNDVDSIYVTKSQGRPYIYFLLYMNIDPAIYHKNSTIIRDQFYFLDVTRFGKIHFVNNDTIFPRQGKSLYILSPNSLPTNTEKISTITNLEGTPIFDIGITR